MIALVVSAITIPVVRDFFALQVLSVSQWLVVLACSAISLLSFGDYRDSLGAETLVGAKLHSSGLRLKHVRLG